MSHPLLPCASAAFFLLVASGCSNAPGPSPSGPMGELIAAASIQHHVPRDLMVAIAHVEGGLKLGRVREVEEDDAVPVAGVLELRHGRFNSLARGAALMGVPEAALVRDL